MQGIDVSSYQPADITCTAQYDFAVVKVSQGVGYENPSWRQQAQCVIDKGRKLGLYHYAGGNDPVSEADYFTALAKPYIGRATLNLDWEQYQNTAWGDATWVRRFVNRVHESTGVWPLVYVQASALGQIPADVRKNCGLWVAQYASNAQTTYQANPWNYAIYGEAMRQYASNGRINGYSGPLDLNYFRGDGGQWDAYANPARKPQTVTKPVTPSSSHTATAPKPSLDTLVAATLRGDYGNLPERKQRLGSDYERVQAEINRRADTTTGSTTAVTRSTSVTVRAGDTMNAIMQRTGLYPLSAWRVPSGDPNRIWPGQTVTYNGGGTVATTTPSGHVVRAGESLWSIYGTGWSAAAARNGIPAPYIIHPGQILR
ncbi:LysM peptidoglycan-binding domain-containing protein [Bifidobacterium sp. 81T8]|nr:LysM peptidoglycan-binding domain-containing protein [Bifidobacterium simiiventris]